MFQEKHLGVMAMIIAAMFMMENVACGQIPFLYGMDEDENYPPITQFDTLQGNGTVSGVLAAGDPFTHIVFFANIGDTLTVHTDGSTPDTQLAILTDANGDGIHIGDAPRFTGNELIFLDSDDDAAPDGISSLVNFEADYTGAYLASINEFDNDQLNWQLTVTGSTYTGMTLACDLNGDGSCDVADIDILYANGDAAEIGTWLAQASDPANPYLQGTGTFVIGDVDLDGAVGSSDLGLLLNNFNSMTALAWGDGNFDGDTQVGSSDLGQLLNNFNHQSLATAVPEPNYLPLVFMAAIFALSRRSYARQSVDCDGHPPY